MSIPRDPSCEDPVEVLMPVKTARARMLERVRPLGRPPVNVALREAAGRVLAAPVHAGFDVPSAANSAMDGYAIDSASIPPEGERALDVIGTAWAGRAFEGDGAHGRDRRLGVGEAVRVFTGAIMPPGADTVVMQEHVAVDPDGRACIDSAVTAGRHVRPAGEDVARGERVFEAGRRLGPADVGVLASLGVAEVSVHARLRVACFTTGDELVEVEAAGAPDRPPGPGLVYDSNRFTLGALLARFDVDVIDLGIVADTPAATDAAFDAAIEQADLIVSSGGISTGDADHVRAVFERRGEVGFWRLAMRPGRPLAFGHVGDTLFFGLPGNPVAVMVTFLQFVQPALRRLAGESPSPPLTLPARTTSGMRTTPGRTEYQRGIASIGDDGQLEVRLTGPQGAGRLSSMAEANCLIVIAPEATSVSPGDTVGVQMLSGLLP